MKYPVFYTHDTTTNFKGQDIINIDKGFWVPLFISFPFYPLKCNKDS